MKQLLCQEELNEVLRKNKTRSKNQGRSVDSLRQKFAIWHRNETLNGDRRMEYELQRADHVRYPMSERVNPGDLKISDQGVLDDNGSTSTPSITSLLTTSPNANHIFPRDAVGEVERGPHSVDNRNTLMRPNRQDFVDGISLLTLQID